MLCKNIAQTVEVLKLEINVFDLKLQSKVVKIQRSSNHRVQ